jgi:hypothetical protein
VVDEDSDHVLGDGSQACRRSGWAGAFSPASTMSRLFSCPRPDWTDREEVAEFAAGAEIRGDDPVAPRSTVTPSDCVL